MPHEHDSSEKNPAQDVPRVGFICTSYRPGHSVHYVAAMKHAPTLTPLDAEIHEADDAFEVTVADESFAVLTHNPQGLRDLLDELGGNCEWYPSINLACWRHDGIRHWVSLSRESLTPCVSVEDMHRAEREAWS
jgi:hypothetical protein